MPILTQLIAGASHLLSARTGSECVVEMQFRGNDSCATLDPNGLPALSSANHNGPEVALDSDGLVLMSADGDFSIELSGLPKPPSPGPSQS